MMIPIKLKNIFSLDVLHKKSHTIAVSPTARWIFKNICILFICFSSGLISFKKKYISSPAITSRISMIKKFIFNVNEPIREIICNIINSICRLTLYGAISFKISFSLFILYLPPFPYVQRRSYRYLQNLHNILQFSILRPQIQARWHTYLEHQES